MTTDRNSEGAVAWENTWPDGSRSVSLDACDPEDGAARPLVYQTQHLLAVARVLDWQPLTHLNSSTRLWQLLETNGLPHGQQVAALSAALLADNVTTPPASIPAAEVQALVERWEKDIAEAGPFNKKDLRPVRFVRELAKLIPRGK